MKVWYYATQGKPVGPVSEADLAAMLRERQLPHDTLVWTEGFGDTWQPANATPLIAAIGLQPPPLPGKLPVNLPTGPAAPASVNSHPPTVASEPRTPTSAYAWLIAASPVIIAAVDMVLVLAGVKAGEPPVSTGITIWSGILTLLAAWKDAQAVERAGLNPQRRALVPFMLLTPIGYFIRRRHVAGLSLTPLWVWLMCAVVFLVIEIALFA